MAKLYFRYGSVGSAKTLNLLAVAHNYRQQNKKVLLMKPALDLRFGKAEIKSRAGLSIEADFLLDNNTRFFLGKKAISKKDCLKNSQIINLANYDDLACIVVDEAQFLNSETIEALHTITISYKVPVPPAKPIKHITAKSSKLLKFDHILKVSTSIIETEIVPSCP